MKFNLKSIAASEFNQVTDVPDQNTKEAEKKYALDQLAYNKKRNNLELQSLQQDIEERRKYAHRIFNLVSLWLWIVALVILLHGFGNNHGLFKLSDSILVTIVGGTTINVLGLFAIVANYLFPKQINKVVDKQSKRR